MVHPRSLKDEIWLQTFKIGKLRLLDINNATLFSNVIKIKCIQRSTTRKYTICLLKLKIRERSGCNSLSVFSFDCSERCSS